MGRVNRYGLKCVSKVCFSQVKVYLDSPRSHRALQAHDNSHFNQLDSVICRGIMERERYHLVYTSTGPIMWR